VRNDLEQPNGEKFTAQSMEHKHRAEKAHGITCATLHTPSVLKPAITPTEERN
jgi:hypothetical protein